MDDKYLDELITKVYHNKFDHEIPTEEFLIAIANRAITRRHIRIAWRVTGCACICALAIVSIWLLSLNDDKASYATTVHNSLYLESVSHAEKRIESLNATQNNIRSSIEQEFPFLYNTAE